MKKVDEKQVRLIIIIAVALILIIFGVRILNSILRMIGIKKSPEQEAYEKMVEKGVISVVNQSKVDVENQFNKQPSTKTDAEWLLIAQAIKQDLQIKNEQNIEDAGYQVSRVQNDTDVLKLIRAFGEKSVYFFGIPYNTLNLSGFIYKFFPKSKIDAINRNYASKRIKFRW